MAESHPRVLVALHGAEPGRALAAFLGARGFDPVSVRDTEAALNALERERMDCLVCEARGPRLRGRAGRGGGAAEGGLSAGERERRDCLGCGARGPRLDGLAVLGRALPRHAALCAVM